MQSVSDKMMIRQKELGNNKQVNNKAHVLLYHSEQIKR